MDSAAIESLTGLLGVMVPITAIVLGIGLAFWRTYWDHRKRHLQQQERLAMIERGMTPPPEPPSEKRRLYPLTPEDSLRRGTILLFLGLGLAVVYFALGNAPDDELPWIAGAAGAIVGFLGLGNLTYYLIARNRPRQEETSSPIARG